MVGYSGVLYRSVSDGNINHQPPNATYWEVQPHLDSKFWDQAMPYNHDIEIVGTWTDADNDIISAQVYSQKDAETAYLEEDDSFAATGSYDLSETVNISGSGDWVVRAVAKDSRGLTSEFLVYITAMGAITKCKKPKFYLKQGKKLTNTEWNLYGEMKLKTKTDGATIYFRYGTEGETTITFHVPGDNWHLPVVYSEWGPWHTYNADGGDPDEIPVGPQSKDDMKVFIEAYASKAAHADSDIRRLTIKYQRWGYGDVL
jgi:hypothetical protein